LLILAFVTCDDSKTLSNVDCSKCIRKNDPDTAELIIYLTINEENESVLVSIYTGKKEENNLFWDEYLYEEEYKIMVPVDKYYTATATYTVGDKTVIAIDGDDIQLIEDTESCHPPCYLVKGGVLDVRLKYNNL